MAQSTPGTKLRNKLVLHLRAARSEMLQLQNRWQKYGPEAKYEDNAGAVREAYHVVDGLVVQMTELREMLAVRYQQVLEEQQREVAK